MLGQQQKLCLGEESYSVKVTEGPNAGGNIILTRFSDSATQTKAKWTINIKNPSINKGNHVEMKFQQILKKIYHSILESASGYSMGRMWQHVANYMKDMNEPYKIRKDVFFKLLEKLMKDGHIRLASHGVFLSGTIEEQIQSIKDIWWPHPFEDEDNDLDDIGR